MALTEHELAAQSGSAGPGRDPDHDLQRDLGRPADRRARRLRQPAPALHRLGRPQHRPARARGAQGLSVSEHGILETESGEVARYATEAEVYERLGLAYIEPELREGNGEIAAAADGELPELVELGRHPRRPALPHDALGRAQLARARWPRRRATAATPTWRSPTTPPATGSATTSPPMQLLERVEEVAAYNARIEGALHAARRLRGQHRHRRLARLRARGARAARLGDRERPHLVSDLARRR